MSTDDKTILLRENYLEVQDLSQTGADSIEGVGPGASAVAVELFEEDLDAEGAHLEGEGHGHEAGVEGGVRGDGQEPQQPEPEPGLGHQLAGQSVQVTSADTKIMFVTEK